MRALRTTSNNGERGRAVAIWLWLAWTGCGAGVGADASPEPERASETEGLGAEAGTGGGERDGEANAPSAADADTTLVIGLARLPELLDPLGDLDPWGRRLADDLVFEGLVRRRTDRAPWVDMALADRCEVDAQQVVDCHLRPDVRFQDGRELTMDDVIYSLRHWLDPRRVWVRQRHGLATMRAVEVVDGPARSADRDPGRWVRIRFATREPLALERLAAIKIVPQALHRKSRFAREPVGTGPMRVVSLERDRVVLERVQADAWTRSDRPLPVPQRVVLRAISDGAEALTLLRRGQVHLVPELAPAHVPVELGKPGMAARFRAWVRSPARYDVLLWNLGSPLIDDPRLRQALHLSVPRAAILEHAYDAPDLGIDAPVDLHAPTEIDLRAVVDATAADAAAAGLPHAPDPFVDPRGTLAAQTLLDASGWRLERGLRRKSGAALRVTLTWDGASGPGSLGAGAIREAWRALGVQTPWATAPWGYLLSLIKQGQFEVALVHLADHDDADLFHLYHSRGELNVARVADASLDRALEDYRAAVDRAARHDAERRIAERLATLRVATVLFAPAPVLLASRRLAGIEWLDDLPRLDALWLRPVTDEGGWELP